jgi:hypothetical protein
MDNLTIDFVFDQCVLFLIWSANLLGITYEEINVYLFCIIWPILTLYHLARIKYLKWKLYG